MTRQRPPVRDRHAAGEAAAGARLAPLWQQILHFKHPGVEFVWVPLLTKGEDKDTRIRAMTDVMTS